MMKFIQYLNKFILSNNIKQNKFYFFYFSFQQNQFPHSNSYVRLKINILLKTQYNFIEKDSMPFGRQLSVCRHSFPQGSKNCYCCGIRQYESPALKTVGFCNPVHANMRLYYKQMKRRSAKVQNAKQISESTYLLLTSICEKFSYNNETLALGLHIYQCLRESSIYEKFWASCCLIVASKAIELDKNVPYLNRYQRYADKDHTQEQYEAAERTIFQQMNFDLQYSTFITFINYFLTNGVIYQSDELNKSLIQYFEDDVNIKAKEYLRKGNFSQFDQEKLALNIIKDTRRKYNLSQWTKEMSQLTGYAQEEVSITLQNQSLFEENPLQTRKYDVNQSVTLMPKTQKVVDLKNICIRKKLDEVSVSKTLLNVNRPSRPNSSAKENSISTGMGSYQTGVENMIGGYIGGNSHHQVNRLKNNNIVLAPITTQQYLSNNSIYNLATKRR